MVLPSASNKHRNFRMWILQDVCCIKGESSKLFINEIQEDVVLREIAVGKETDCSELGFIRFDREPETCGFLYDRIETIATTTFSVHVAQCYFLLFPVINVGFSFPVEQFRDSQGNLSESAMADQTPQSPTLKDLPKVQSDLKSQLEHFDTQSLKNIDPQEKVVLPTAEGDFSFLCRLIISIQKEKSLRV